MKKITLSVCLVVKNEARYLAKCLESVSNAADEIIVVDTGSTDESLEIAGKYTDMAYSVKWRDDFSKVRNYALNKAKGEWILFLDGDEELTPESVPVIKGVIEQGECEGCLIKVLNYYNAGGRVEVAPDVIFRLFRNKKEYRYSGAIHEQICDNILMANPGARINIMEDICVIHYGYLPEEVVSKNKSERNTKLLLKAVKKNPNNLLDHFHLGVEYFRVNKLDKALQEFLFVFDKVDVQAVYAPKLMRYITKCHYLLGDLGEALHFIENVWVKYYPDQGDIFFLKGIICKDLKLYFEAFEAFNACLHLPPQPSHYANLYCQYKDKIFHQLGEIAEYYTDKEQALRYYIDALRENPSNTPSLARIVAILEPRKNPDYTVKALSSVFDLSDPDMQLELGRIFFQERAYGLAVEWIERVGQVIPLSPSSEALLIKGLSLLRQKLGDSGQKELECIPPGPYYVSAQGNLFIYHWLNGDYEKAEEILSNISNNCNAGSLVIVLEALLRDGFDNKDEIIRHGDIYAELMEVFERVIELEGFAGFDQVWSCVAELYDIRPTKVLGGLFFKYELFERAIGEYLLAVARDSGDGEVLYRIGKSYLSLSKPEEAQEYYHKALAAGFKSPQVNLEMARLYQELAVRALETGLGKLPDNLSLKQLLTELQAGLIRV